MPGLSKSWQLAWDTSLAAGVTSRRHYFFTESLPAGARNVFHAYGPVEKLGAVLSPQEPWEYSQVSTFCSTILRLEDGRYRMYYTAYDGGQKKMCVAVAESADGLAWEKIPLGQVKIDGHDTNYICFANLKAPQNFVGQPQVLRLPDGRWRMYFWHHGSGYRYTVAHSRDGLVWEADDPPVYVMVDHWLNGRAKSPISDGWDPSENPELSPEAVQEIWRLKSMRTNDASYVYYNPQLNRFEYYAQWFVINNPDREVKEDNCPRFLRCIQRRFSADGLAWSAPELIIQPDDRDPWDMQFYHLAIQWHEDWMIGSLGHYRVEQGQQTQDLELVFSRDGKHWHRPLRGGFIPRDPQDEKAVDSLGIYPPNAWIDKGNDWLCLYHGDHQPHNKSDDLATSRPSPVLAARWPKNRMLGLQAGAVPGGFLSEPFFPQGETITIDATIQGWLRAELCDVFGRKHDGYHLMDSAPITGNSESHVLKWKDKTTRGFKYDPVRVRFEFCRGTVYTLNF